MTTLSLRPPGDRHMDQLPGVQGSALAVICTYSGWSLWAIVSGRLIPRTWVEAMRTQDKVIEADLRERLHDANEAIKTKDAQLTLVLEEQGRVVTQVMRSLPIPDDRERS